MRSPTKALVKDKAVSNALNPADIASVKPLID